MGVSREGRCHGSEAAPRKPSQSIASGAVPFLGITGAANSPSSGRCLGALRCFVATLSAFPSAAGAKTGSLEQAMTHVTCKRKDFGKGAVRQSLFAHGGNASFLLLSEPSTLQSP